MTSISSLSSSSIQSLFQTATAQPNSSAASSTSATKTASASASTPSSMQDKVDSLLDNAVSSGKLTNDQATQLKSMFAKVQSGGHHHGGGGIKSLLASDDSSTSTGSTSTTSSGSSTDPITALAQGASSVVDGLASFVGSVRSAVSSNGLYGAGGSTAGHVGSMLVNSFA